MARGVQRAMAAAGRAVDRALGVRTSDFVPLEAVGAAGRDRVWHSPSSWIGLWRALRRLDPGPDDVFVDVGAGLGRALVVATRFPFRRIVGVEVSAQLAATARANVAASRLRAGERIEVVVADAETYSVPDDVTVVYMFCPFTGAVFAGATEQLLASVERRPRRVRLVYTNPLEHDFLLWTGRFRPVDVIPASIGPAGGERLMIVTYEVLGAPGDTAGDPARLGEWAAPRHAPLPHGFTSALDL